MDAGAKEKEGESDDERMIRELAMLEAALYVAGRPLNLKTLGYVIGTRSKKRVRQLATMLMKKYKGRDMALEVLELEDHRFVLHAHYACERGCMYSEVERYIIQSRLLPLSSNSLKIQVSELSIMK